ncbi:hypothetical protein F4680DRAFT_450235 [Xylaria scruposa]|nr:hypothetical protein F4680DRAFT_450235 [Xylaria scruposa]
MASNLSANPSFNKADLERVTQLLSLEAINIVMVPRGAIRHEWNYLWEDVTSWMDRDLSEDLGEGLDDDLDEDLRRDLSHYKNLYPDIGHGALLIADLWKRTEDMAITGSSPIFIFLTTPDPITDLKKAWRCLLSTLICKISGHIKHIGSAKLRERGVLGGQHIYGYFPRVNIKPGEEYRDDVGALIELLSAFQHCDYDTEHSYVVVIDRMTRFFDGGNSDYSEAFFSALRETLVKRMGAYILFIDEMLPAAETPVHMMSARSEETLFAARGSYLGLNSVTLNHLNQ